MGDNFTLFQNAGGSSSGGSAEYVKDAFQDISMPANTNAGYTSTVLTNPNSQYFQNDDQPRYLVKTLYIKDLVEIQDRTKWINNQITYEIIWNENCPAAKGYIVGNARLRNFQNGKTVEITNIDNLVGVTGVIRQIAWIINPTSVATGTADLITDGVDTGSDASFGGAEVSNQYNGLNEFNLVLHNTVKSSQNIHDYRLQANETSTLNVCGVVCYFENTASNIDCFPGSTYVDKDKKTSTANQGVTLPIMSGRLGGRSVISKNTSAGYDLSTIEPNSVSTIGAGSINTNLINTSTGHGASFPVGTMFGAIASGTSFYFGIVTNQSTDTLTVAPTLGFGLSGPLFKTHYAGPTLGINASLYILDKSLITTQLNNSYDQNGFGINGTGDYYYSDPQGKYRVWGDNLQVLSTYGFPGITFQGATSGFIQIDGSFAAAEIELVGAGINNHTVYVNGLTAFTMNSGLTGVLKRTIFTDSGPGRNSIVIAPGTSLSNTVITNINLYQMRNPIGVTTGLLAQFDTFMDRIPRAAANATLMDLGSAQRIYADQAYFSGPWTRGTTHTVAGGVYYIGTSSNSALKFQYYGTDFAMVGTIGNSTICAIDGASINSSFGVYKSATLGWHSVQITNQGSSGPILSAIDYIRPSTSEILNLQNYLSTPEQDDAAQVFTQSDTPRMAKNGDLWVQQFSNNANQTKSWIRLGGKWNQIQFSVSLDDPNAVIMVKSHGSSTGDSAGNAQSTVEHFNFVSWSAGFNDAFQRTKLQAGDAIYASLYRILDGQDTASGFVALHRAYNKASWATVTARTTARCAGGVGTLSGIFYVGTGSTASTGATSTTALDSFNNTAWTAGVAAFSVGTCIVSSFVQGNKLRIINGSSGGSPGNQQLTFNGTATSTDTAIGVVSYGAGGSPTTSSQGLALAGQDTTNTAQCSRVWNGSSWSANIATSYLYGDFGNDNNVGPVAGFNPLSSVVTITGGSSATTTSVSTSSRFNGSAWSIDASSATARAGGMGGVF